MTEEQFDQLRSNVILRLKNNLASHLYYHCLEHTERVLVDAEFIAKKENVT
jgi:HD superfamily phosphodiesterase